MTREDFLDKKLNERKAQSSLRVLQLQSGLVDFCSNDYLGVVKNKLLDGPVKNAAGIHDEHISGSTGSRLLSGNYELAEATEKYIAGFHDTEAALLFNSGYDANIGLLGSVPQKGDTIIYDQLSHASIRDGIRLSFAQAWSFAHNDTADLEKKLQKATGNIFVVTESVFSMDGDLAPLQEIAGLCENHDAHLIVDEAHSTGIIGSRGEGLVQSLNLTRSCFARVHTFGKAMGAHGAVVVGSMKLRNFLINFSRPFIYTTALPPASVSAIKKAYEIVPGLASERKELSKLISVFHELGSGVHFVKTPTPIQAVIIPGNENVKRVAKDLYEHGIDIRPILYPTVPKGTERLRIVLHSFNTVEELKKLTDILAAHTG
jgi:8-amino-7-oxononanoate synthase